jgi:hypothetical protein
LSGRRTGTKLDRTVLYFVPTEKLDIVPWPMEWHGIVKKDWNWIIIIQCLTKLIKPMDYSSLEQIAFFPHSVALNWAFVHSTPQWWITKS